MPEFKMVSNEGIRKLHTKDLLTAVKMTCDYEGDLFANDRRIISCLNNSQADNTRKLLEYGITSYVNQRNYSWNYRYTDPTKNVENYYVHHYHYSWGGDQKIDFTIKEYPESDQDHMFTSLADVMKFVRKTVAASPFQHDMDTDIYVKLFGADGLIHFAYGDWKSEGEPQIFALGKEGHKPIYGAKHYMRKRYDKLQAKFGGYTFVPADSESPGVYKAGDVIVLKADIDGLDHNELYLISKKETTGEDPELTIQSLKDYKVSAKVQSSMITFPKIGVKN